MTHNIRKKQLGEFLKSRRQKLSPESLGLPTSIRRRTKGLRREEVAMLSGVSVSWYTWLEQGRDIHVSNEVLSSLSKVLKLSDDEETYLLSLAENDVAKQFQTTEINQVNPIFQSIMNDLKTSPSMILDIKWNVIAWNKATEVSIFDFSKVPSSERNCVWLMFTNTEYMSHFENWEYEAQGLLARFRSASEAYMEDTWFVQFVSKLKEKNSNFASWWSIYEIAKEENREKVIINKTVGKLVFEHTSFTSDDNSLLKLYINTPTKDSLTEQKMKSLIAK